MQQGLPADCSIHASLFSSGYTLLTRVKNSENADVAKPAFYGLASRSREIWLQEDPE